MIKKDIYEGDLKARLRASAKSRQYRFLFADGMMRGAVLNATQVVSEMRANHELGSVETLLLGQAYIAASLLTSNLKGKDRVSLHIECSGAVKGLDVEANMFGEVRGYLKNSTFSSDLSGNEIGISSILGAGFLTVTRYLEEARTPYSGKVMLEYGTIAEDLANYFVRSEQTPTAFSLSVHFDEHGHVDGAGGMLLQAMPGAGESVAAEAEDIIRAVSLGAEFAAGVEPEHLILEKFAGMLPLLLGNHRVEFFCRCNEKTMRGYISRLPQDDLRDIALNGPFPLEIRCHNCNTLYSFSRSDIEKMLWSEV